MSVLARFGFAKSHPPCCAAGWNPESDGVAYLPAYLFTLLVANGENVKVVQELMPHANSRSTLEIYSQARIEHKRKVQQLLAAAIFPDDADIPAPIIQCISQDNLS